MAVGDGEVVDLEVLLGGVLLRAGEVEVGEGRHVWAKYQVEDHPVELELQGLADPGAHIALDDVGLFTLETGAAAGAGAAGDGAEVGAAPDRGHGAVHPLDEGRVRELALRAEIDGLDLAASVVGPGEFACCGFEGVQEGIPFGGSVGGIGDAFKARHPMAAAVDEPVAQGEVLVHPCHGAGDAAVSAFGHEPGAGGHVHAVGAVGFLDEPHSAFGVLAEPEWHLDHAGGVTVRNVTPDDVMDGVAGAVGGEELVDQEPDAAEFVLVQGGGDLQFVVESLQDFLLPGGQLGFRRVFGGDGQDIPVVPGDGGFGLRDDRGEDVVADFHGIDGAGQVADESGLEFPQLAGEFLRGEVRQRVEPRHALHADALDGDQVLRVWAHDLSRRGAGAQGVGCPVCCRTRRAGRSRTLNGGGLFREASVTTAENGVGRLWGVFRHSRFLRRGISRRTATRALAKAAWRPARPPATWPARAA